MTTKKFLLTSILLLTVGITALTAQQLRQAALKVPAPSQQEVYYLSGHTLPYKLATAIAAMPNKESKYKAALKLLSMDPENWTQIKPEQLLN